MRSLRCKYLILFYLFLNSRLVINYYLFAAHNRNAYKITLIDSGTEQTPLTCNGGSENTQSPAKRRTANTTSNNNNSPESIFVYINLTFIVTHRMYSENFFHKNVISIIYRSPPFSFDAKPRRYLFYNMYSFFLTFFFLICMHKSTRLLLHRFCSTIGQKIINCIKLK